MEADRRVDILECTLRDGSYAIDYQFTAEDTGVIALGLERAGFRYIEIGHGLGLDASSPAHGQAAASDAEYMRAAREALSTALFGSFFIPGLGDMDSLALAAEAGMGFIRIGTNVTEIADAEPYIKRAKELGLVVSSNLMKSYAVPLDEFVKLARQAEAFGADIVCVVDSAGGMMPDDVTRYTETLAGELSVRIGYHGHNNLDLALANSIAAVQAGATVVDASLQGMGRSAGNAQTEILAMVLEKLGYKTGVDVLAACDLGERIIRPMAASRHGIDSVSAIMGLAQFHSSFEPIVARVAEQENVDIRELILAVSEIDRIAVTEPMARKAAHSLSGRTHVRAGDRSSAAPRLYLSEVGLGGTVESRASDVARQMAVLARKTGSPTVMTIARSDEGGETRFPYVRHSGGYIIGNVEAASVEDALAVAEAVDGHAEWLLVDVGRLHHNDDLFALVKSRVHEAAVLPYDDIGTIVASVRAMLYQMGWPSLKVAVLGGGVLAHRVCDELGIHGIPSDQAVSAVLTEEVDVLLVTDVPSDAIAPERVGLCLDCRTGSRRDALPAAEVTRRIDVRAGLTAAVTGAIDTSLLLGRDQGARTIDGVRIVAGGAIGAIGDIVVDSITSPTIVIGVADGRGGLLDDTGAIGYTERAASVRRFIARTRYLEGTTDSDAERGTGSS